MDKSFGLLFYLKKPKGFVAGDIPVYLRVTVDGESFELSSKRKCAASKWNTDAGRMNGKGDDIKAFNTYLDTLQQKVFEAKRKLIELDKDLTPDSLKSSLLGKEVTPRHMILEIFRKHNEQMEALVPQEYAPGTLERYRTSLQHTQDFMMWKYKASDMDIRKLDYEFIEEYAFWLKSERKCAHNTTMKYLSNFRKIVNRCIRSGWLHKDPFIGFNMTKREVDRTALTEHELSAISNKRFTIKRLEVVRDIFLFSCYSGLAYADVEKLKRSEITTGVDGKLWIVSRRQKTEAPARIPLLPLALSIIEKYKDDPECAVRERILPVLSNQKMNAYLKEIADLCGISKTLTYHIARHTFATTITLSNGVPIETVSKMLGHRSLRTTQHYAKILDRKISNDMKHLYEKYQTFE
ncbi:MAG: site-specific integrase [Williamsia sp.]|nr:site-specific integrase [Williamsia sp.]